MEHQSKSVLILIGLTIMILFCTDVFGASVVSVSQKKRSVIINEGSDNGITKGVKVCFFDANGKKMGCGRAKKVKPDKTMVKIGKKLISKIKKGISAEPSGKGKSESSAESSSTKSPKGSSSSFLIRAFPLITVMGTTSLIGPNYVGPTEQPSLNPVWVAGETIKPAYLFGAGLELGVTFGEKFAVTGGVKIKMIASQPNITEEDYLSAEKFPDKGNFWVENQIKNSSMAYGGWLSFQFYSLGISDSLSLNPSAGIDYEMSGFDLIATRKDDKNEQSDQEIAKVSSKISVISLRLAPLLAFNIDKFMNAFAGLIVLIPVTASVATTGEVNDPNISDQAKGFEDLKVVMAHGKSSFGLEIPFGFTILF